MLANDDLTLDPGCVDAGLNLAVQSSRSGIGGSLAT